MIETAKSPENPGRPPGPDTRRTIVLLGDISPASMIRAFGGQALASRFSDIRRYFHAPATSEGTGPARLGLSRSRRLSGGVPSNHEGQPAPIGQVVAFDGGLDRQDSQNQEGFARIGMSRP
jgi:hypothetical protein